MKISKNIIVIVAAASLGLGMSAMAQGRGQGRPPMAGPGMHGPTMGGPGGMRGPGMAGPGTMGNPMGRNGQMGPMDRNQMGTQSGPRTASQLLTSNTKLASHLAKVLGVDSKTLLGDANGYKNLGLFVAAYHVSKNLNIPFDQLTSTMASNGGNLGKAVHTLQPNLSKKQVKSAVKTAKHQAKSDIKHSRK